MLNQKQHTMTTLFTQSEQKFSNANNAAKRSNYSEASVQSLFDAEAALDDAYYSERKYAWLSESDKQLSMMADFDEISACNDVYDYYND